LPADDERFWHEVRALPSRQAQCVALHYLEDRPVVEIAEILGCSSSTVKVHLHRGRLALAERLHLIEDAP
jgi:RNA polymerase sigma-70 factor (ECF subfamily)